MQLGDYAMKMVKITRKYLMNYAKIMKVMTENCNVMFGRLYNAIN